MLSRSHCRASTGGTGPSWWGRWRHFHDGVALALDLVLEGLFNGFPGDIHVLHAVHGDPLGEAHAVQGGELSQTLTG